MAGRRLATDWTLTAAGPTPGVSGPTGDPSVTGSAGDARARYALSESGPGGLRGVGVVVCGWDADRELGRAGVG